MGSNSLARAALLRFVLGFVALVGLLLLSAGSLDYWQAWAYCVVLFVPVVFVVLYFLKRDPRFWSAA